MDCISSGSRLSFKSNNGVPNAILIISNVTIGDRNRYQCTRVVNNGTDINLDFWLRVRDPLGPVWPTLGIVIEALVLFVLLFVTEWWNKKPVSEQSGNRKSLRQSSGDRITYGSFRGTEDEPVKNE